MKRYAPLFAFAAVEKVKSDIKEPVIQVAIGFPLGFFDRAVKEIAPLLRTITVSGHTIRMEPLCYPQGYGVLADYRLNEAGSKMPGTDRNLLIVDVGFNTIDICSVEEGRFRQERHRDSGSPRSRVHHRLYPQNLGRQLYDHHLRPGTIEY